MRLFVLIPGCSEASAAPQRRGHLTWITGPRAEQTPQGSGRRRPFFSVPRLHRGVHRPAAAALRTLARGYGLVGWPGLGPAAAVARRILAVAGRGSARSGLARLRGRLHILPLICRGLRLLLARCWAGRLHEQNRYSTVDLGTISVFVLLE